MSNLAIIPARGGSKRLKRKNLREVAGKSLLQHAIDAAKDATHVDDVVVISDDEGILDCARSAGVLPIREPPSLAGDNVAMVDVAQHALLTADDCLAASLDSIVLLQPSSPIRTGQDIDACIEMLGLVESVISVCLIDHGRPGELYRIVNGRMVPTDAETEIGNRRDFGDYYVRNGAIYAFTRDLLMNHRRIIGDTKRPYVMPEWTMVNVDTPYDLMVAEHVVKLWKSGKLTNEESSGYTSSPSTRPT